MSDLELIDVEALSRAKRRDQPYPHILVPQLIKHGYKDDLTDGFPALPTRGSFPTGTVKGSDRFEQLAAELQSDTFRDAVAAAFGLDLSERFPMLTVRGFTGAKDGRIHTDTKAKLVTVLVYLNDEWPSDDGRLRLLNGPDDLDDHFAEVVPSFGSCVMFLVTENCWHGHKPFVGERRAMQLNYVTDAGALRSHMWRHKVTATAKSILGSIRG
ncbi:MAG: 2OG-Fe(II) oxygenase [Pyrinomonadaceae bacterium]